MKSVHLVIPDLLLPPDLAAAVCAGLETLVLGRMLGWANSGRKTLPQKALEQRVSELCGLPQGVSHARLFARHDGLEEGHWLRADPVYLEVQRDRLVLQEVALDAELSMALCDDLNRHFAEDGLRFLAPHPQRWYVRCDAPPRMKTTPLFEAVGQDVQSLLPSGAEALAWVRRFNEIQMLLYSHSHNEKREASGLVPVNSLWFWGEGSDLGEVAPEIKWIVTDHDFSRQLAAASGLAHSGWRLPWQPDATDMQLLVWEGLQAAARCGDWQAWRESLATLESALARPLWEALRAGRIDQIILEVGGVAGWQHAALKRRDTWAFWRRNRSIATGWV